MEKQCAWCRKVLPASETKISSSSHTISHGICEECADFLLTNKPGRKLQDFLDTLHEPIMIINDEGIICGANHAAQKTLHKPLEHLLNELPGDAMECAYARLQEGCGRTEHCKACTIRHTVMGTHADSKPRLEVTSIQDILTQDGTIKETRFVISTEKRGKYVFVRIDDTPAYLSMTETA